MLHQNNFPDLFFDMLKFKNRLQIDERAWNECIEKSLPSLPYAFSWYLDAVAENWSGLVFGNYEAVMPLVFLKKLGVPCIYQPHYCQQLGFFSKKELKGKPQNEFLKEAAKKFPYIQMQLNASVKEIAEAFKLKKKKNLLLPLSANFNSLQKNFSENHKRNIAKAKKAGLVFSEELPLKDFQTFYLKNLNPEKEKVEPKHEKIFKQVTQSIFEKQKGKIFVVVGDNTNNGSSAKTLASIFAILHQNRIIALINSSSEQGKKNGAAHLLFNAIIEKYSGSKFILDFEGSSVPSVARFYEGFGAEEETFYLWQTNLLKQLF